MSHVVGVAGVAGSGKSTLVRGLVKALGNAASIHIDDYQRITREPIRKIVQWMERGAEFDEFKIPLLSDHLERLKRGERIVDPLTMREILPQKYIVFETLFGRAHRDTGRHVDFLVWVDTPLDVALARNLRDLTRSVMNDPGLASSDDKFVRVHNYVQHYLDEVRPLVLMQQSRVSALADISVDGGADPETVVENARREIVARLG